MRSRCFRKFAFFAVLLTGAISSKWAAGAGNDLQTEAHQAMQSFVQKDPTLENFFKTSAGYVVFPSIGQGGFIVGGAHGKGLVYQNGKIIGEAVVTKASIGAQVGGQSFAEIIFFQTPVALQHFKGSNYELSAGVSAVVASDGAARTARYQDGVAVFTMPKSGAMVQAAIGGQKFKFEPGPEPVQTPTPTGR